MRKTTLILAAPMTAALILLLGVATGPAPSQGFTVDPALILEQRPKIFADGPIVRRAIERAETDEVRRQLEHLLTDKRDSLRRAISLSTRYLDHMAPILERHGLPKELAFLCIIESGYTHSARSHAGAVGMWQIIRATSSRFGLRTDIWADERLDFERSTEAAARFINYLQGRFEDWDHILAAYNAGEGRVKSAIAKARRAGVEPMISNLRLPRETKIYVPAFYAALLVALEPERYGVFPEYEPSLDFHVVNLAGGVELAAAAAELDVPLNEIKELNPSILRGRVPPGGGNYPVRVPCTVELSTARSMAETFEEVKWITYRVKRGDTLWDISRRFGVSASQIDRIRRGTSPSRIFPGELLVIPLSVRGQS